MTDEYTLNRPTALTCPECGGALSTEKTGTLLQFRCHIGHVLTADTMLAAQYSALEWKLGACMAALNERAELCRLLIEAAPKDYDLSLLQAARREALERARVVKELLESDWIESGRDYVRQLRA